jgi:hypothetical protein
MSLLCLDFLGLLDMHCDEANGQYPRSKEVCHE